MSTPHARAAPPETPARPRAPGSQSAEILERKLLLSSSTSSFPSKRNEPHKPSSSLFARAQAVRSPISFSHAHKRVKEDGALFLLPALSRSTSPVNQELALYASASEGEEEDGNGGSTDLEEEHGLPVDAIPTLQVERELGRGNFGSVSLVKCKENLRRYALKEGKDYINACSKEVQLEKLRLWSLSSKHRNIVPFLRAWQDDAKLCVLMAYCPGGDLESFTARHDLCETELLTCTRDMMDALVHLHGLGVVHLDCKPANICLSRRGVCKLTDFDQAKRVGSSPPQQTDYTYMAKELLDNLNYSVEESLDVFSMALSFLGVALRVATDRKRELPLTGPEWTLLREAAHNTPEYDCVRARFPRLAQLLLPCLQFDAQARVDARAALLRELCNLPAHRLLVSEEEEAVNDGGRFNRPESANLVSSPPLPPPPQRLGVSRFQDVSSEDVLRDRFNSVLVSPRNSLATSPVNFLPSPPSLLRSPNSPSFAVSSPVAFLFPGKRSNSNKNNGKS